METTKLRIEGMHCDGCAERLGRALTQQQGVREADVSVTGAEARVRFNPHAITRDELVSVVRKAGYDVAVID